MAGRERGFQADTKQRPDPGHPDGILHCSEGGPGAAPGWGRGVGGGPAGRRHPGQTDGEQKGQTKEAKAPGHIPRIGPERLLQVIPTLGEERCPECWPACLRPSFFIEVSHPNAKFHFTDGETAWKKCLLGFTQKQAASKANILDLLHRILSLL